MSVQVTRAQRGGVELGYAEITSNQTGITTQADITGLTTTVTVGARPIVITADLYLQQVTNVAVIIGYIMEGATQIQARGLTINPVGFAPMCFTARIAPTAGSHTYKVQLAASAVSASVLGAAANPSSIRVVEV
jgi:hypothetical protein